MSATIKDAIEAALKAYLDGRAAGARDGMKAGLIAFLQHRAVRNCWKQDSDVLMDAIIKEVRDNG